MTEQKIIKHINEGTKYYIRMFAYAEHMEIYEKEEQEARQCQKMITPIPSVWWRV